MRRRRWDRSQFDAADEDPLSAMSNLVDIMLVFACGLIAALAAQQMPDRRSGGAEVVEGREMPDVPEGVGELGSGYEAVGQVYRDSRSGKLILIGPEDSR